MVISTVAGSVASNWASPSRPSAKGLSSRERSSEATTASASTAVPLQKRRFSGSVTAHSVGDRRSMPVARAGATEPSAAIRRRDSLAPSERR